MDMTALHRSSRRARGRRPGAAVADVTVSAIDAAYATWDDVDRALAFGQAISDARAMISRLAAARQQAIADAHTAGKSFDTIAVEMGITRTRLGELLDGQPVDVGEFSRSSPARRG
ncbi:MAG TPA: hypothetical protein VGN35_12465 [Jatrophihabitantaceae bacterium]|jgi:hypothetical protein|nr:hypothetical protein [Jatrophihabitantaceae bacterium]